jgi:phosphatidate cytidylyltransferase
MPTKRIWTALVGLPLFVLLIYYAPPFLFFLAVLVVALVGQSECYNMLEAEGLKIQRFLGLLLGALIIRGFYYGDFSLIHRTIFAALLLVLIFRTLSPRPVTHAVREIGMTLIGLFWVCFFFGHLVLIREQPLGSGWIFFLFLVVWAGDTGAYYVGRYAGRRKLFEKISPNKTIEGAVGGLCSSVIGAVLGWGLFLSPDYSFTQAVVLGALLAVVGQMGDLVESLLKRSAGVKDSGSLFPGHGGVLDRFDGILLSAPVLYYLII